MRFRGRSGILPVGLATMVLLAATACSGGQGPALPKVQPAIVTPPTGAVVEATEWGTRDLAIARTPGHATVQIVDYEGHGVDGLDVWVDGRTTRACGPGCYRTGATPGPVTVRVGSRTWQFSVPSTAPSGRGLVREAMHAYAGIRSVAMHQRLASSATNSLTTSFLFVAPDRLRYAIEGGSEAIIIGRHRWDRSTPEGSWVESSQTRTRVMNLPWSRAVDIHVVSPHTVTFFDLTTRAWFRVTFDAKTALPTTVHMTGVSHFMVNAYSRYNGPASVTPPQR